MSIANEDHPRAYQWAECHSLNTSPLTDSDDLFEDELPFDDGEMSWTQTDSALLPQDRQLVVVRQHLPWGKGEDAIRCACFRNYPMATSSVYQYLLRSNASITKNIFTH
jgi:hypothetical protein